MAFIKWWKTNVYGKNQGRKTEIEQKVNTWVNKRKIDAASVTIRWVITLGPAIHPLEISYVLRAPLNIQGVPIEMSPTMLRLISLRRMALISPQNTYPFRSVAVTAITRPQSIAATATTHPKSIAVTAITRPWSIAVNAIIRPRSVAVTAIYHITRPKRMR